MQDVRLEVICRKAYIIMIIIFYYFFIIIFLFQAVDKYKCTYTSWHHDYDIGPTLYKWYTNVLCLRGCQQYTSHKVS